jgi:hypothetical protein
MPSRGLVSQADRSHSDRVLLQIAGGIAVRFPVISLSLPRFRSFAGARKARAGTTEGVLLFSFGKDSFEAMKINWLECENDFF